MRTVGRSFAKPSSALIAGGGFIGLEMAEAFAERGLKTTVVELMPRIMSTMDPEFGAMIAAKFEEHGVRVITGLGLKAIHATESLSEGRAFGQAELSDGSFVDAGIVLLSIGVRPELTLAKAAGLVLGPSGGLEVNDELRTSDPSIFAAGDMIEGINDFRQAKLDMIEVDVCASSVAQQKAAAYVLRIEGPGAVGSAAA